MPRDSDSQENLKDPNVEPEWGWLREPGVYCDTYAVDIFQPQGVVRLTFGEYTDKEHLPYFRSAVVLPIAEAKALGRWLIKLIEAEEKESKTKGSKAPTEARGD